MHAHYETKEYVRGAAMARLEAFNNPEEGLHAGIASHPMQAVTWSMLEGACLSCPEYRLLHNMVMQGAPEQSQDWDKVLPPLLPPQTAAHRHRSRCPHQREASGTQIPQIQSY